MLTSGNYALIVEDDPDDRLLAKDAFEECCPGVRVDWARDGEELFERLADADRMPGVILLDLNMPRFDGRKALLRLKEHTEWRHIPVLVVSASPFPEDVIRSNENGVNGFFRKSDYAQLKAFMNTFGKYWVNLPPASYGALASRLKKN